MRRTALAWVALVAVVLFAWRWQLDLGFTDTDALADVVAARHALGHQLTMPLTDGVAGDNANFWRPVVNLHYWAMRAAFGWSASAWQAWDLLLHVACMLGLGAVVRAAGGRDTVGLAAGAIFGLHPAAVEVVPAVARNIDVLMTGFVLLSTWALLKKRLVLATLAALLAMGTKESALALIPALPIGVAFLHGRRPALAVSGAVTAAFLVFLGLRSWVLDGAGGYSESVLAPVGLERVLRTAAPELLATGFGHHFVDWPWPAQLALGVVATALVAGAAWSVRDQRGALVGIAWLVLPLVLVGLLGVYGRRHLYLPLAGWSVLFAYVLHHRVARWGALPALGLVLPHTPLVHPDRDWALNDAVTTSVLALEADLRALPEGAVVWVMDRCIRVNADPVRAVWFGEGESQNNCVAHYSLQAWLDEVHGGVRLSRLSGAYPRDAFPAAQVEVGEQGIVVTRALERRFVYKAARQAGWDVEVEGDSVLLQMDDPENDWLLVLSAQDAVLVPVP